MDWGKTFPWVLEIWNVIARRDQRQPLAKSSHFVNKDIEAKNVKCPGQGQSQDQTQVIWYSVHWFLIAPYSQSFPHLMQPSLPRIAWSQSPFLLHKSIFPRLLISTKIWTRCFWKCHGVSAHVSLILIVANCKSYLGKIQQLKIWNYFTLNKIKVFSLSSLKDSKIGFNLIRLNNFSKRINKNFSSRSCQQNGFQEYEWWWHLVQREDSGMMDVPGQR